MAVPAKAASQIVRIKIFICSVCFTLRYHAIYDDLSWPVWKVTDSKVGFRSLLTNNADGLYDLYNLAKATSFSMR